KEIHRLDQYCKNRFIDLVPNQNSFGHMENWLKHDQFLELAECPEDCATKWGARKRTSLDPTNSKSLDLMKELYAELLPNFSSHYFNIGCDETIELGLGRSKVLCDSLGVGVVYLNYLKQLNDEVNKYGKITQFWGDIIVNHKDLILQVPKNMIALAWGYERDHKFDRELPLFKEAGIEFYVCPGISTWRSLIGRNNTAFANIRNAAVQGKLNGAEGLLNTSWGDYGHWQPMSVSYPAIMIGASYAWNCDTTAPDRVGFQLNHYIFQDTTGNTGKALMKLGDAYLLAKIPEGVANVFHLMLHRYKWTMQGNYQTKEIKMPNLQNTENEIKEALLILDKAKPDCDDADIVLAEIRQAANLALHSLHLGIARLNTVDMETKSIPVEVKMELAKELLPLIENHKKLWLKRDRYGGLEDSAGKLQEIYDYYMLQEEILEQ
ncbi:MAG: family 20 glycosylhydrolase, partial [Bacteroidales bacterium]